MVVNMKKHAHLFRDEQHLELSKHKPRMKFGDDMDVDLLPLFHSSTKKRELYRFFEGHTLFDDLNISYDDYNDFCEYFDFCKPDTFIAERVKGFIRKRTSFKFELGCELSGKIYLSPSMLSKEYSELDDVFDSKDEDGETNYSPYTWQEKKILNNPLMLILAKNFLDSAGIKITPGKFRLVSVNFMHHTGISTSGFPAHKDTGFSHIAMVMIKSLGLKSGSNGIHITRNSEFNSAISAETAPQISTFDRKEVFKIDTVTLSNPLDMLVIDNKIAYHDVSVINCAQRDLCIFGASNMDWNIKPIAYLSPILAMQQMRSTHHDSSLDDKPLIKEHASRIPDITNTGNVKMGM
jgi:hypothetical protein